MEQITKEFRRQTVMSMTIKMLYDTIHKQMVFNVAVNE